jgi:hypothetical protein
VMGLQGDRDALLKNARPPRRDTQIDSSSWSRHVEAGFWSHKR